MTTVVYDGKYLACDSRTTRSALPGKAPVTCGTCGTESPKLISTRNKLRTPQKGKEPIRFEGDVVVAWASAGASSMIEAVDKILSAGLNPKQVLSTMTSLSISQMIGCTTLIVTDKHVYRMSVDGTHVGVTKHPLNEHQFCGSGASAARLMLKHYPLTAFEATFFAADADPGSGGAVQYIDISTGELQTVSEKTQKDFLKKFFKKPPKSLGV